MNEILIKINANNCNKRVDIALSEVSKHSRSMIQKLIYANKIMLNNEFVKKANQITKLNEIYSIYKIASNISEITPEKYDLDILYEDEFLIVLNKPAELIVHPGAGNFNNTLINKLAHHCLLSNIGGPEKLGTIHRLDKGVSGCIIFAKDNITHINLSNQFTNRTIKKKYLALSHNCCHPLEQYLENYIARSKLHRQKMSINTNGTNGKLSKMNIKIKEIINYNDNKNKISFIDCFPITGRTHQIRVQLSNIGLPILNDPIYGKKENENIKNILQNRIALHASEIIFHHPKTERIIEIKAKIPSNFEDIKNIL